MNKTKIEWADMTFNPVTGCLHGCEYCYARRIAKRFGMPQLDNDCHVYTGKVKSYDDAVHTGPFPWGFAPTLHKYRFNEPQKIKKPSKIFVVSMGDLFGDWVPDEWIEEVFKACEAAPWHTYMFLTKNPKRFGEFNISLSDYYKQNLWFGTTVTDDDSFIYRGADLFQNTGFDRNWHANRFLSIEPLLGKIDEVRLHSCVRHVDWVIIGQQTNPDKPPQDEWVQSIIDQCQAAGVPVFVKSPLYEQFPIQEWPEGLK